MEKEKYLSGDVEFELKGEKYTVIWEAEKY